MVIFSSLNGFPRPFVTGQLLSLEIAIANLLKHINANLVSCNSLKHETKELLIVPLTLVLIIIGCNDQFKCLEVSEKKNN